METLNPGRELDALIAEKLFGLNVTDTFTGEETPITSGIALQFLERQWRIPKYSTDIKAAWPVAEKVHLFEKYVLSKGNPWSKWGDNEKWYVLKPNHYDDAGTAEIIAEGESAPHAICLAALESLKKEKP